jgi:peroxiredoxin Q/BCP
MIPDLELDAYPGPGRSKLSDFRGRWLVLYFYPRDDTPGCTKEACGFRDSLHEIQKLGAQVVGVSTDSVASHSKFSKKYGLNFTLLSDMEGRLGRVFGVLRDGASVLTENRVTFLVDPEGRVRKVYPRVIPTDHSVEVLNDLKAMMTGKKSA